MKNKVNEVKHIINLYQPKIFGLSEVELKKTHVNESSLQIEGYTLLFPKSWYIQGQARVVMYIKNYQNYVLVTDLEEESFQSIWIRIHQRRSKPIYYCHAYREHLQEYPIAYQRNQLEIFLKQWESAQEHSNPSEVNEIHVSLDMNLDSLKGKWLQNDYSLLSLAKLVQNYCDMGNLSQMVDEPTRFMFNSVSKSVEVSCLDHVYTN